jgi:hypothetical protein
MCSIGFDGIAVNLATRQPDHNGDVIEWGRVVF